MYTLLVFICRKVIITFQWLCSEVLILNGAKKMIADMRTRNSQKGSADRPKSASFVLCGLIFFLITSDQPLGFNESYNIYFCQLEK